MLHANVSLLARTVLRLLSMSPRPYELINRFLSLFHYISYFLFSYFLHLFMIASKSFMEIHPLFLRAQGYFKVLGKGRLPEQPVIVKAKFFSRIAEQKIRKAGGVCVLTA
jgi:hypothetical protein